MRIFLKLTRESILIAFQEIANNRLRAFLSLLGISIGIFCIISVFTSVDSLEKNVRNSFNKLGEEVVYIQKFPWTDDSRSNWWKFYRRPNTDYNEFQFLKENMQTAEGVTILLMQRSKTIKYLGESTENTPITASTYDYKVIKNFEFEAGRYFSYSEMQRGQAVAVIGYKLAEMLFVDPERALGKQVQFMNRKVEIIGVLEKEGEDIVGFSSDDRMFLPYNYLKTLVNTNAASAESFLAIKANENTDIESMQDEARGLLRSYRKLKPKEEDNFAMNKLSIISGALSMVFGVINIAGAAIGLFSILVGGFGVANIMFVSVRERTAIIGIKKALGAKKIYILIEFLVEAVVLCFLGGLLGLFLVYIESFLLEYLIWEFKGIRFDFDLSLNNIILGMSFSVLIGIVAGFIPALNAAKMKPVDAFRYK